ncbi:ACT domain-containing protein [Peptococcaceae bacterium]|nr:ACT domain-containing protein [Peptococcaceae bacterium]
MGLFKGCWYDRFFSYWNILASLINPLVEAKISIFALSTYNTDYNNSVYLLSRHIILTTIILIKKDQVDKAIEVLKRYGHIIKC